MEFDLIKHNLKKIKDFIVTKNSNAKLVAVSKYRSITEIVEAVNAGQKDFGENKVQEAKAKWPKIKEEHLDIKLHLIGHLQTNKSADAISIFDVIEVVDRKKLVDSLAKEVKKQNKMPEFLMQVNISGEPQKSGCKVEEIEELLEYSKSKGLSINGLMCIPNAEENPKKSFHLLRKMCEYYNLEICSMGMSSDYKIALECGSTQVRIGTDIFGKRPAPLD